MTTNVNIGYKGVSKSVCCLVRFPTDVVWVAEPDKLLPHYGVKSSWQTEKTKPWQADCVFRPNKKYPKYKRGQNRG